MGSWGCICQGSPKGEEATVSQFFTKGHPSPLRDILKCQYTKVQFCQVLILNWASLVAQLVKNLPAVRETWVWSLGWEDPWRRERLPTPVFWPGEFHGLYSLYHGKTGNTERWALRVAIFSLFAKHPLGQHWLEYCRRMSCLYFKRSLNKESGNGCAGQGFQSQRWTVSCPRYSPAQHQVTAGI